MGGKKRRGKKEEEGIKTLPEATGSFADGWMFFSCDGHFIHFYVRDGSENLLSSLLPALFSWGSTFDPFLQKVNSLIVIFNKKMLEMPL